MQDKLETVDCLGDFCPIPIMKLKKKLKLIQNGKTVLLITDHSCALTNVSDFCKIHKLNHSSKEVLNGVWEITISR